MSGQLSTTFEISEVELTSDHKVFNSISLSGKRFARLGEYHQWKMKVSFNIMTPNEMRPLMAFLNSQRGGYETFTFIPPGMSNPRGNWGTITVSSVTDDNTIVMAGFSNNDSSAVKAGDIFTLAGDTKVYMVNADAASDGSGNATVNFDPDLVTTPSGGAAVTHTGVAFTVQLDKNDISWRRRGYNYESFTINLVEAMV